MALQLIDLGNEVEVVEIDTSKVPYTFSVKLTDKIYTFTVKYNEAGRFFTVDLATSDGEPARLRRHRPATGGLFSGAWKTNASPSRSSSPNASPGKTSTQ